MVGEYAAYAERAGELAGIAERMTALAGRLDRGARLVTEGTDESGRVSVQIDRAGLPETIRIRADWRAAVSPDRLPAVIGRAYSEALTGRMTAARQPVRDRFATDDDTPAPVARLTTTVVPSDQLSRSFERMSAEAWARLEQLQQAAADTSGPATPTGVCMGASGRITVIVSIDLRLDCRVDARWADPQTGAALMNALNPALHGARNDLARAADGDRLATAAGGDEALLGDFLALLNDPHRFADILAGRA